MADDAGTAQARELLRELHDQVGNVSRKLAAVESHDQCTSVRGELQDRRQLSALRQELSELHYLIAGLHRRYPETLYAVRAVVGPHATDDHHHGLALPG